MGGQGSGGGQRFQRSVSANAGDFDPDLNVWDRQPTETSRAYDGFVIYLTMEGDRKLTHFDHLEGWSAAAAAAFSSKWSWGWRAAKFDVYMSQQDTAEIGRHRLQMNRRQRKVAREAQEKIAEWLRTADFTTLKPFEAARWYELAVRVEREATDVAAEHAEQNDNEGSQKPRTLGDLLGDKALEDEMALTLHRIISEK